MKCLSAIVVCAVLASHGAEGRLGKDQKCMAQDKLKKDGVDLKLVSTGKNTWADKEKKNFVQEHYQVVNKGQKAACGVELYIPSSMEVFSNYGGVVKAGKGGLHATLPPAGLAANTSAEFGFILQSSKAVKTGEACISKYEACK